MRHWVHSTTTLVSPVPWTLHTVALPVALFMDPDQSPDRPFEDGPVRRVAGDGQGMPLRMEQV